MSTVGMIFRTYTSNWVGAEALGLLQLITSVYYPACTLASSGIYVAATNLCAKAMARKDRSVEKIVTKCLIYSLSFGMAAFLLLHFGAKVISHRWLNLPDAEIPLKILSFGLPFLAASNALQGFFLSLRKATYSTVLQVSEDLLKIGASVLMFHLLKHRGPDAMLLALVAGMTVGEIGSCLFGYFLYRRRCPILPVGTGGGGTLFASIARIALPCAFSAYLRSGIGMVESVLVPKGLQASGLTAEQTLSVLGKLEGMALPILMFPATFLSAVSRVLVPEIAAENAIGNKEGNKTTTESTLRWTLTYAIFLATYAALFGKDLGRTIYGDEGCGRYIAQLAPLVPVLYCDRVTDGIMKGYNRQTDTARINLADAVLRTAGIRFLLPIFGMSGYIGIFYFGTVLNFILSFRSLKKAGNIRFPLADGVVRPALAALTATLSLKALATVRSLPLWGSALGAATLFLLLIYGFYGNPKNHPSRSSQRDRR